MQGNLPDPPRLTKSRHHGLNSKRQGFEDLGLASIVQGWGTKEPGMGTNFLGSISVDPRSMPVLVVQRGACVLKQDSLASQTQVTVFATHKQATRIPIMWFI